ncbi:uncharacterized protein LOC131283300 [Anopheles ziemanni]|uniref:uncharacterized protein LOC131262561 n=1 Tax=Anopheles coustani TaxID=139045 RepID=UPI0026594894|nr:uncharacterized protein LOC131262561 [Anopheles coustani]XP_058168743.1 uncharacterized protein LOC131283300 [Anopheles ziemanni]
MDMEPCAEFKMESLESFEPLVNPIRQYRNRSKRTLKTGEEKLAEVLAKIASLQKNSEKTDGIDRTKVRTYNVKLRLKKSHLYKCFDCGNCFANPDFLELHEKSHTEQGKCNIDLGQEPVDGEMNLKQNAWFVGDFDEHDRDDDGEHFVQLDCTVEEGEDIFDITFDRTKCEKTYTMKYKVKKEPVGKCEYCAKQFYSAECWKLHELEHEKFLDITSMEPSINIMQSPKIEESTMTLDESFYEGLDVGDILERSSGTIDCMADGRLAAGAGITLEYRIIPRRSFSADKETDQPKDRQGQKRPANGGEEESGAPKKVNQSVCQPTVNLKEEVLVKEEPVSVQPMIHAEETVQSNHCQGQKDPANVAVEETDAAKLVNQSLCQPTVTVKKEVEIKEEPISESISEEVEQVKVKTESMAEDHQPPAMQMHLEQEHKCAVCSKRFRLRIALLVHEQTHDRTRPYSCQHEDERLPFRK